MAISVPDILAEPGREWSPAGPARVDELAELPTLVKFQLPAEYLDLLRCCDGGSGELDAAPLWFVLYSIAEAVSCNESELAVHGLSEFWFFGGNGGLELIAFDLRRGPPWQIVMIDPIAGAQSAVVIADSMTSFIQKIGHRSSSSEA